MAKNELVKQETPNPPAYLAGNQFVNNMTNQFLQSIESKLPIIKVAAGGINKFEKDNNHFQTLDCIIVGAVKVNVMWLPNQEPAMGNFYRLFSIDVKFEDDKIPVCSSIGAVHGTHPKMMLADGNMVFGQCQHCYFNRFKSDLKGGAGKACKNGRRLLILTKDSPLPNFLALPPTSIRPYDDYVRVLMEHQASPIVVYSNLTLVTETNKTGQKYSVVKFNMPDKGVEYITDEDFQRVQDIVANYASFLQHDVSTEEFGVVEGLATEAAPPPTDNDSPLPLDKADNDLPF